MIVFFQRALRNYMQISSLQSFHRPSLTPSPQGVLISTPEFFFKKRFQVIKAKKIPNR